MRKPRIVYMGTPEFAVAPLQALCEAMLTPMAVITAPDKPKGRGLEYQSSPVKVFAKSQNIPVLQPTNLKNTDFIENLKNLQADLFIVVAFRMLPESVWTLPKLGTFNLHASLLPNYRGAAPINWVLINGEKETGVTTFFIEKEIDTGSILFQEKIDIRPNENFGELYERLMKIGAKLTVHTTKAILSGDLHPTPQTNSDDLKLAPKIFKESCWIDWNWKGEYIKNFTRGLDPIPGAFCLFHGKNMKIYKVEASTHEKLAPGQFATDNKSNLWVGAGDMTLRCLEIQLEGKKRMKSDEFLRGYKWPHD